jgi:hypothetical protein
MAFGGVYTNSVYWRVGTTDLPVLCWCEKVTVIVPIADIRAGRTLSCGDPRCKP